MISIDGEYIPSIGHHRFIRCPVPPFCLDVGGKYEHALAIAEDQVAGRDADPLDFDRHAEIDDLASRPLVCAYSISSEVCASISAQHACFASVGRGHRGPRLWRRLRARDRPSGHRFSDRPRPDARPNVASAAACANWPRSSVQNDLPTAGPSRRNDDPAFGEEIFDVTEAEREPQVEPNRLLNDLRREPVARVADFRHTHWLPPIESANKQSAP